MENEQNNENEGWPPSNYPTVTLAIFGSLSFRCHENTLTRLEVVKVRFPGVDALVGS